MRTDTDSFSWRRAAVAATALTLAAAVLVAGLLSRRSQAEQLQQVVAAQAVSTVKLISPSVMDGSVLELPGRLEAWSQAPIHARVSGYLRRWTAEIGGAVKAGQLLGEIDTPELDEQLSQARAELATARSNAALAESTARRWQSLLATDSVSRQEADEKAGDLSAKQSVVNGLQANVERVQALKKYARLVAPFDGVVTARNTDVGALIGAGGAPGSELFVVSDVRRLRVYVNVPQRQVASIGRGTRARLVSPERPSRWFDATVESTARSIQSGSGTMLVQLAVDNKAGELLPGGFATVRFDVPVGAGGMGVPPSALMFGKEGVRVATVDSEGLVRIKKVDVARDLGSVVELAGGIERSDRLVESPPDGLANGDKVRIAGLQGGVTP
ncbi:efflux RND transporter periplasmic adaptor subunit [Variovorax saccharolyticus]|uniref:efflux RND transporter periplasmic adaptor subunit n=1 Tax=Variovorax saccharolyticus TaxID=3053516 RepID=UPI002578EF64|nr:efflux RND transporter periplasmic adaptor subunit [Variovorax sp. J22R187]MDM0021844.1 efflux RND transporter periplasmic adaptor subunit [Variovorax sp. J22R187]